MDKIVEHLSSSTTSLEFEDIPRDVVHQGKRLLVDTLACARAVIPASPAS
jgi:2-methylcitrate dehydratase PrpD